MTLDSCLSLVNNTYSHHCFTSFMPPPNSQNTKTFILSVRQRKLQVSQSVCLSVQKVYCGKIYCPNTTHHAKWYLDETTWVVLANIQFATVRFSLF